MPFLAPIFAGIGAIGTALGITASTIYSAVFSAALSFIQMMMNRPPKPEELQSVYKQSIPIRMVHSGRVRTGGPVLFIETRHYGKGRQLFQIVYFSEGEVDAFEEWFLDSRPVSLTDEGWVKTKLSPKFTAKKIQILSRVGADRSTVYAPLMEAFPGVVTKAWRGDGLATAMISALPGKAEENGQIYPSRIPALNTIARFAKPYDPRTSTYKWTENFPLLTLYFATHKDGLGCDLDDVDLNDFKVAANEGDEFLTTKNGGTVRRYHGSNSWRLDERPLDVIKRLELCQDGRLYLKGSGKIGFETGRWRAPSIHIRNIDIIDAELRSASDPMSEADEVVVKYSNPNANYTQATAQPWRNERAISLLTGPIKSQPIELFGINNHNHARRIAKLEYNKLNAKYQGTIVTNLAGMLAWDQRFITLDYDDLGIVNQAFEVNRIAFDEEDMTVMISITSTDASRYDFDAATEEGTAPVDPASLGDDAVPTPTNFRATVSAEVVHGVKVLTLRLDIDVPEDNTDDDEDNDLTYEFQYSPADTGRWRKIGGTIEENFCEVDGLTDGAKYDARVRYRSAEGAPSDWLLIENIIAIGDSNRPAMPSSISARITGDRQVTVTCTSPIANNFAAVQLWRGTTKDAKAAKLVQTTYGAAASELTLVTTEDAAGSYYYFVGAINFSGVSSPLRASSNNPIRLT